MKRSASALACGLTVLALLSVARPASARQNGQVEVGASLANISVVFGNGDTGVLIGIPSATFSIFSPSVFAAFHVAPRVAVEPQIGLVLFSGGGSSGHLLNFSGQFDYFLENPKASAPYIFGTVGVLNVSSGGSAASVGGGAGYRIRKGDRLILRIDGRVVHFTNGGGNLLSFGASIGGLFGK
jgi:hypothetical protein